MESYRDFARVYDEFMDQTPYDEWLLNILNIFKEYKIDKDAQVLDLGCGTGKMARKLAREGAPRKIRYIAKKNFHHDLRYLPFYTEAFH